MDKEKIKELIETIEEKSQKYTNDEFILAVYLLIRYGKSTFENYIDSTDLDKIHKELKQRHTLFDEELNYIVDKILNNKEL